MRLETWGDPRLTEAGSRGIPAPLRAGAPAALTAESRSTMFDMKRFALLTLALCGSASAWSRGPVRMSTSTDRRAMLQKSAFSALAAGAALGSPTFAAAAEVAPVGSKAPSLDVEFPVENLAGKTTTKLSDVAKWKLVYFYPLDNSAGCTTEAVNFQKSLAEIRGLDAEVIGVSPQDLTSHKGFISKLGLEFPLISDDGGELAKAFGAQIKIPVVGAFTNRETYIIDPEGTIRWKDKNVEAAINSHATTVVKKLKELQQ